MLSFRFNAIARLGVCFIRSMVLSIHQRPKVLQDSEPSPPLNAIGKARLNINSSLQGFMGVSLPKLHVYRIRDIAVVILYLIPGSLGT